MSVPSSFMTNYEVIVHSICQTPDSELRRFLLRVQVRLGGKHGNIKDLVKDIEVLCPGTKIDCHGVTDRYSVLYTITETVPAPADQPTPCVSINVEPSYNPMVANCFKLDEKLALLVGKPYLVRPKYAITLVLAYARAKKLETKKAVMCDALLQRLLGVPWLRPVQIWEKLTPLMHRYKEERLELCHRLTVEETESVAGMQVHCDLDYDNKREQLFPGDWDRYGEKRGRSVVRATTLQHVPREIITKKVSGIQKRSKRSLKKHMSI